MQVVLDCPIAESARVAQVRGLFDLPPADRESLRWNADLPLGASPWSVGLITGPSGCGKSTVARSLWPAEWDRPATLSWPARASLLDAFPGEMSVKEVTALLGAVGFNSPPAWLRPFGVLSTGQQFRVTLARLLAEACPGRPVVLDEFTSVVDRTVARVGSAALARAVRDRGLQFVAVTCHEDVIDWLQPDWVFRPALAQGEGNCPGAFTRRLQRRRPDIALEVARTGPGEWPLFAPHHYLSGGLIPSAWCFLARWEGRPVCFSAWLPFVGRGRPARREHRTVCLPDFQGAGIGLAVAALVASMWRGLGFRALSTTTHPALMAARLRSPHWVLRRAPSLAGRGGDRLRHATTRLTGGFEYTGPALVPALARRLLEG